MARAFAPLLLAAALAGCGSSAAPAPKATPSPRPLPTVAPTKRPAPTPTPAGFAVAQPKPKPTKTYLAFVSSICHALRTHDAGTVQNALMNYQYNTGVRYGNLGDGEGTTGDAGILNTWLANAVVRCRDYSPDIAGHGTLLTSGWQRRHHWGLIEMDYLNGSWKINDFTFGTGLALWRAMQTSHPILAYRG